MAENLERISLNLILPIMAFCGPIYNQASVTLKIDAVSMFGKLLQAFEDLVLPWSKPVLEFVVAQLDANVSIINGTSTVDAFEAMIIRELYAEFISQSVDLCCSMVLISPKELAAHAKPLFERCSTNLKLVTDINCKYEIIELLSQMALLATKSGEEQTPEEDFLDFEMRRMQSVDELLQELKAESSSSSSASSRSAAATQASLAQASEKYQKTLSAPIWPFEDISFDTLHSTLVECTDLFEKEEYENDIEDEMEENEEDEEDDEEEEETKRPRKSKPSPASTAASSSAPSFESQPNEAPKKNGNENETKRRQDESGTATVIALLSSLSFRYFKPEEYTKCFELVHGALLKKINAAFSSSESYNRLPAMLDSLAQFLGAAPSALVAPHFAALTQLLESIMKQVRIWKSEDPSPLRRRTYAFIRSELLPAYSALIRQSPESLVGQTDHFMNAVNFLLADSMILAEFGSALASIKDEPKKSEAEKELSGGLLFKIVDAFLRELSNPEASVSMKKMVMQSMGRLATGTGALFAPMLQITVPVLLFLGQQVPDLAPAAITATSQLLLAVRSSAEMVTPFLIKGIDQAIAMVLQDIVMSGFELSSEAQKASGEASKITFNFAAKSRLEEDEDEEDAEDEIAQDDNLADLVYKGECFLAFVMHVPEFVAILESTDNGAIFDRIFTSLLEIEEKPALFEEDSMLKMTGVDILLYMIESISRTHSKAHRDKAVTAMQGSGVEHFEEELEEAISRLKKLKF